MSKFAEWMKNNDKKQIGVAQKIGISQSTLHEILKKGQMPSLKAAYQIELYTNGVVTMYNWLDEQLGTNIDTLKKKSTAKNIQKKNNK